MGVSISAACSVEHVHGAPLALSCAFALRCAVLRYGRAEIGLIVTSVCMIS
jgi:hypothetical protein